MFPAGTPGAALALLRASAAAALLDYGAEYSSCGFGIWLLLVLAIPASALLLGVLTPYASGVTCLLEIGIVISTGSHSTVPVVIAILNTTCLGILGPGAYSLDALLFGRRIVEFPHKDDSDIP